MMRRGVVIAIAVFASLASMGDVPTREEIIERMRSSPVTRVRGLVQVVADCPADLRREFQGPVSTFSAGICNTLYGLEKISQKNFKEPGIAIYIGSGRTNDASVVARPAKRSDGTLYTRIFLPAPGFSDLERLRLEVAKAFYRCVRGIEIDDSGAEELLLEADPELRKDREYELIEKWERGEKVGKTDEEMLKLCRSVLDPGFARESDVLRFGARLRLYPESYARPFCGRYRSLDFAQAVRVRNEDPRIRLVAYVKTQSIVLYGGGRGEKLAAAAEAYSKFLMELARNVLDGNGLEKLLAEADGKYEAALEEARRYDAERTKR